MGIEGKLERDVDLKASADKFFKRLSTEMHHTPTASSDKVHAIDVHEFDWETAGSIKLWTYTKDEKTETFKEKIEVDEETKTVTMVAVEGHVLDRYKKHKVSLRIVPNGNHAVAKITMVVEKEGDHVVDPHDYMELVVGIAEDIDEHLVAQAI